VELTTQKYLRIILPGVFLYGLLVILCWTTTWCELAIPQSWEELTKLLAAIVLGIIYHLTGLREISNRSYHYDINKNISARLIAPFLGKIPDLGHLGWNDLRHLFYYFVDKDESLKVKSSLVRFNGLVWTSVADLRSVSLLGIAIFFLSIVCSHYSEIRALKFNEARAYMPIFIISVMFLSTFILSQITTDRHRRLRNEQCDYILLHYRKELKTKLTELTLRKRQL